jgi:hypothetical protein
MDALGRRVWDHLGVVGVRRRVALTLVAGGAILGCTDQSPRDAGYSSRIRDVCSVRKVVLDVMFVADTGGFPPRAVGVPATLQFQPTLRVNPSGPTGCAVRGDVVIEPRLPFAPTSDSARRGQFAAEYGAYLATRPDSSVHLHFNVDAGQYYFVASLPLEPEQLGSWFATTTPGMGSIVVVSRP